jgi:PKD repeat protein
MKKSVMLIIVLLSFFSAFVSAEIQVKVNDSLVNTDYTIGSPLSGQIYLDLKNVPAKATITSNLGGSMSLRDFLKENSQPLSCESFNCSSSYSASSGSTTRSFSYPSEDIFGFQISEKKNVQIKSIRLNLTSNFQLSDDLPIELLFFENSEWRFDEASGNFDRFESFGCFDPAATVSGVATISTTKYCERVSNLPSSKTYKLGATLSGSGSTKMFMSIKGNSFNEKTCEFDASNARDCLINLEESLPAGEYLICINAEDDRRLYSFNFEKQSPTCGNYNNEDVEFDYPLFVRAPKYASSNVLNNEGIDNQVFDNMISSLNENYLKSKYPSGDCSISGGCVFPVEISRGVPQTIQVSNVQVYYSATGGEFTENKVYSLSSVPLLVNINKTLDLEKLGFVLNSSGNKTLILSIDGVKIFEKKINVVSAPIINSVSPLNPLAGVPTEFTLDASSNLNITNYKWSFGDGTIVDTQTNKVSHTFKNNSIYTLQVFVTDSNEITASKNFTLVAGNPSEIIGVLISAKKSKLERVSNLLGGYPSWQSDTLKKLLKLQESMEMIKAMEQKKNTIFSDEEYVKLALELNSFVVPQEVYIISEESSPFLVNEEDIDPTFISELSFDSEDEDVSGYKKGISQWERENIQGLIVEKKIGVLMEDGTQKFLANFFRVDADSLASEESYFILNKDFSQFITNGQFDFKNGQAFSYLVFEPKSTNSFEFIYASQDKLKIYVSPDTKYLPYEAPLGACNFNLVCEPNKLNPSLGENYKNCRSDCKPVGKTVYWILIILLFFLGAYTALEIWYKRRYETKLFVDRAQLFNIVNYIDSMRNRNVPEGTIRMKLAEQGWDNEQINYAVKKSKGQNTGMYELIPVDKLLYLLRDKKSKSEARANPILMPQVPRRMPVQNTNLNKPVNLGQQQRK